MENSIKETRVLLKKKFSHFSFVELEILKKVFAEAQQNIRHIGMNDPESDMFKNMSTSIQRVLAEEHMDSLENIWKDSFNPQDYRLDILGKLAIDAITDDEVKIISQQEVIRMRPLYLPFKYFVYYSHQTDKTYLFSHPYLRSERDKLDSKDAIGQVTIMVGIDREDGKIKFFVVNPPAFNILNEFHKFMTEETASFSNVGSYEEGHDVEFDFQDPAEFTVKVVTKKPITDKEKEFIKEYLSEKDCAFNRLISKVFSPAVFASLQDIQKNIETEKSSLENQ